MENYELPEGGLKLFHPIDMRLNIAINRNVLYLILHEDEDFKAEIVDFESSAIMFYTSEVDGVLFFILDIEEIGSFATPVDFSLHDVDAVKSITKIDTIYLCLVDEFYEEKTCRIHILDKYQSSFITDSISNQIKIPMFFTMSSFNKKVDEILKRDDRIFNIKNINKKSAVLSMPDEKTNSHLN